MDKLAIGDRIQVPHTEDYPYERLPEGAHYEHQGNAGNTYSGLISIVEVVPDE